jgi:hypothetical protein
MSAGGFPFSALLLPWCFADAAGTGSDPTKRNATICLLKSF